MHELIERKRLEMIELASKYGMTNSLVVKCSQELDILLNAAQADLDYWFSHHAAAQMS